MKLILRQYLASLRERDELDAVLPDLLSQMGLNVFSRPSRGTRQYGVDVGAVGSLDGGPELVYLFSVKDGDLTRRNWDGERPQSLRPSLNEIIDVYIGTHLPVEHRGKEVVVCVVVGGEVREDVRLDLEGYFANHTADNVTFQEWNGDKLAELIQSHFLREELLPPDARSRLRKSLALLDEPSASYSHFAALVRSMAAAADENESKRITILRQMGLCLWIVFAWARDDENLEAAYLAAELALLYGWRIVGQEVDDEGKLPSFVEDAYRSIVTAYQQVSTEFLNANVLPHAAKLHAVSSAIHGSNGLDVNLKLFDLLGRLGVAGMWALWGVNRSEDLDAALTRGLTEAALSYMDAVQDLITSNPALLCPVKDDQAIDIAIAVALLRADARRHPFVVHYFTELMDRASFAYRVHGRYPCTLRSYEDLLSHPVRSDEYRERVTRGSILYPMISVFSALLDGPSVYEDVAALKRDHLRHCNFQVWFPDSSSEDHLCTDDRHGAVLSDVDVTGSMDELLSRMRSECNEASAFEQLTSVRYGWWPLVAVACHHHRVPLPLQLILGDARSQDDAGAPTEESQAG